MDYMYEGVFFILTSAISAIGFFVKKFITQVKNDINDIRNKEIESLRIIMKEQGRELTEHRLSDAKTYLEKGELTILRDQIRDQLKEMSSMMNTRFNSIETHLRQHYDRRGS